MKLMSDVEQKKTWLKFQFNRFPTKIKMALLIWCDCALSELLFNSSDQNNILQQERQV